MDHTLWEVTGPDFEAQVLESALPVLIEFTADWCPPCKMLAPILHQIGDRYAGRLRVGLLNSDDHPDLIQQYGVMGLPTLMLFVDGAPVERIVGYVPREKIEAKLLPHLANAEA